MALKYSDGRIITINDAVSYAGQSGRIVFWNDGKASASAEGEDWTHADIQGIMIRFTNGAILAIPDPALDMHLKNEEAEKQGQAL